MTYYGRFYRSALYPLLQRINTYLLRWAGCKYRRLRSYKRFTAWWSGILAREPALFTHGAGRARLPDSGEKSGVTRDYVTLRSVGASG